MNTTQNIIGNIAKELDIAPENITVNDSFESLGADSLDLIAVIVEAENTFNVIITDDDLNELETVQDLINVVDLKLKEKEQENA